MHKCLGVQVHQEFGVKMVKMKMKMGVEEEMVSRSTTRSRTVGPLALLTVRSTSSSQRQALQAFQVILLELGLYEDQCRNDGADTLPGWDGPTPSWRFRRFLSANPTNHESREALHFAPSRARKMKVVPTRRCRRATTALGYYHISPTCCLPCPSGSPLVCLITT